MDNFISIVFENEPDEMFENTFISCFDNVSESLMEEETEYQVFETDDAEIVYRIGIKEHLSDSEAEKLAEHLYTHLYVQGYDNFVIEVSGDEDINEGKKHGNSKEYDKCWDGYKKVPGKKRGEKGSCVKEGFDPEHFDGETEFYAVGDDGEETSCTLSYTATIIDGKPVVHPRSLSLSCPMDHNSKLGFDDDMDFEMQDADEMLAAAQEDADEQWAERDDKYAQGESLEETYDGDDFHNAYGEVLPYFEDHELEEAEYRGRKVKLGKPMRGDVKKFKVYVKNAKGNVVKVNFGDPNMRIKKSNPKRRKSFRARHNCDSPGPRWKARYWSCRKW